MNRRSVNLRDATRQDIIDVCSAMEQLFLFYKKDDIPFIYIINLLELLLQSARTRVCILRLPQEKAEKKFTLQKVKNEVVVFANFRDKVLYTKFCTKLTTALNADIFHFFSYELEQIPSEEKDLFFCLPRITVRTGEVQLDHSYNREAYHRIRQFLQTMYLDKEFWSLDLLSEFYHCMNNIPHNSNLNCSEACISPKTTLISHFPPNSHESLLSPQMMTSDFQHQGKFESPPADDDLLAPIYEWADYVYKHASESRLIDAVHHNNEQEKIDYSNIFFFLRQNRSNNDRTNKNCENFDVRIICPEQQRKELSQYYHRKSKEHCQWYSNGSCRIHGMPQCEFESHWRDLPPESENWDDETIYRSYEVFWEGLEDLEKVSQKTSEAAFRNNSVVFERYAKHKRPDGEKGYFRIDPEARRDRLMACIRYRLLPAPDASQPEEDHVPQVMFVPIYTGGAPFVLAATVVNAKRPELIKAKMTEWRMAYRFAGMVLQFLSSRLKEAARKTYLNATADIMGTFAHNASKTSRPDMLETHLQAANHKLKALALTYPYQQILLSKHLGALDTLDKKVNNDDRRFFSLKNNVYEILVEDNIFWCHYSTQKQFFTLNDVARKFKSALGRNSLRALLKQEKFAREILIEITEFDPNKPSTDD